VLGPSAARPPEIGVPCVLDSYDEERAHTPRYSSLPVATSEAAITRVQA
jgi:hypothetical protein